MAQYLILHAISTIAFLFVCSVMATLLDAPFIYVFGVYNAFLILIFLIQAHQQRDATPWVVSRLSTVVYFVVDI